MDSLVPEVFKNELDNAKTNYFIFDTKGSTDTYSDIDFEQYHWETNRFNSVKSGDLFLYRRPGKASENGRFYFFGAGVVGAIEGEKEVLCDVVKPVAFERFVYQEDLDDYRWLHKDRTRNDWQYFFNQYGMNRSTKEDFMHIFQLGFNNKMLAFEAKEISGYLKSIQRKEFYVEDTISEVKVRAGHTAFANTVKANYSEQCALCGLTSRELLRASHIIPWSIDKSNRLNPQNGICLCVLHDSLFDKGFIAFDEKLRVMISKKTIKDTVLHDLLRPYHGAKLKSHKNKPDKEFLKYHRDNIFSS